MNDDVHNHRFAHPTKMHWVLFGLSILITLGLKIWLQISSALPFNADEAITALMARHILQGNFPLFFYGQAYMGSLDALLVAGGFSIFGQEVWVIRLIQSILYLGTMLTTAYLAWQISKSANVAIIVAFLMAVPTVNVSLYTSVSLGGYGETLLIGNLILILAIKMGDDLHNRSLKSIVQWGVLGFLIGLGFWAFGLSLVYSLPALSYLGVHILRTGGEKRTRLIFRAGSILVTSGLIGALPWLSFAVQNGLNTLVGELGGGAIAGIYRIPWMLVPFIHLFNLLLLGTTVIFGFRPPWEVRWLAFPLIPFILALWMVVFVYVARLFRERDSPLRKYLGLLLGVILAVIAGFLLTPFGADPSGRYFIPLVAPLTIFAGLLIQDVLSKNFKFGSALLVLLVGFHFWGTYQCVAKTPPGLTTQFDPVAQINKDHDQALKDFLLLNGETRGYSNYWVAYPLAFLTGEEIIFIPRLPYHQDFRFSERDDRYAPYGEWVENADRVAYITTNHDPLNEYLRTEFERFRITWSEQEIGGYLVFYRLSQKITPTEIGLGRTTTP